MFQWNAQKLRNQSVANLKLINLGIASQFNEIIEGAQELFRQERGMNLKVESNVITQKVLIFAINLNNNRN